MDKIILYIALIIATAMYCNYISDREMAQAKLAHQMEVKK
jgi:hypothetical protein